MYDWVDDPARGAAWQGFGHYHERYVRCPDGQWRISSCTSPGFAPIRSRTRAVTVSPTPAALINYFLFAGIEAPPAGGNRPRGVELRADDRTCSATIDCGIPEIEAQRYTVLPGARRCAAHRGRHLLGGAIGEIRKAAPSVHGRELVGIHRPRNRLVGPFDHQPSTIQLVRQMPGHDRPIAIRVAGDPALWPPPCAPGRVMAGFCQASPIDRPQVRVKLRSPSPREAGAPRLAGPRAHPDRQPGLDRKRRHATG